MSVHKTDREQLIEEAAKAIYDASWQGFEGEVFSDVYARIAFAVFEKTQEPTDDEQEALAEVIEPFDFHGTEPVEAMADAILAAGFRRTVQGEPTDAEVRALMQSLSESGLDWDDVQRYAGRLDAEYAAEFEAAARSALRAAAAVREEGQGHG